MATIQKKLIHFKKKSDFLMRQSDILDESIVFIKDTNEIYTHGTFYKCSISSDEIESLITDKGYITADAIPDLSQEGGAEESGKYISAISVNGHKITVTKAELPKPASITPLVNGTATLGSSLKYAREDHVHPKQTTLDGNATTSTKLNSNRTFALTGAVTGSTSSNLENGFSIATTLNNFDASKITSGTIDIARLPKGALERLILVNNQEARFGLTSENVQEGDTVKQIDTGTMYFVIDANNLNNESGYSIYTAGAATSVPWSGVTDKPTKLSQFQNDIMQFIDGTDGSFNFKSGNVTQKVSIGKPATAGTADYANIVNGLYTYNGGNQRPNYVTSGKIRWNMMNMPDTYCSININKYMDMMLMDTYSGGDVPYVTALGITKEAYPQAYIFSGRKGTENKWETYKLATENYVTQNLSNYITKTGDVLISGQKIFNTEDNTKPLIVSRNSEWWADRLLIGVNTEGTTFYYNNVNSSSKIEFTINNSADDVEGVNRNINTLTLTGSINGIDVNVPGIVTSNKFVVKNGTASQFIKADGSLDNTNYLTAAALNGYATQSWVQQQGYLTSASSLAWSEITGKPTTLGGYGITDAVTLNTEQTITGRKTFSGGMAITAGEENRAMPFFLGIEAFNEGGDVKWITASNVANAIGVYTKGEADGRYVSKSTYTAADVLAKIKTVDGSGSGLDADTLDGEHKDRFNSVARFGTMAKYVHGFYKIKIKPTNEWMLAFKILAYQTYCLVEIDIAGYNYGPHYWYSPSASLVNDQGERVFGDAIDVTFGYDDVSRLWIAIPAHSYAGISITDVVNGYQQVGNVHDLFDIVYEEELTGTVQETITAYRHASINDNVASATKLQTPRTIWGQSFDGTANVSGNMIGVGVIRFSAGHEIGVFKGDRMCFGSTRQTEAKGVNVGSLLVSDIWADYTKVPANGAYIKGNMLVYGNVGVGTPTPAYTLDVNGVIHSTDDIKVKDVSVSRVLQHAVLNSAMVVAGSNYYNTTQTTITGYSNFSPVTPDSIITSTKKLSFSNSNFVIMKGLNDLSTSTGVYVYCLTLLANDKIAINGSVYE